MRPLVVLLALLVACSDGDAPPDPAPEAPAGERAKAKAKAPAEPAAPAVSAVDQARGAALSGDGAAALDGALAELSKSPDQLELYLLVRSAAASKGGQDKALAALDSSLSGAPAGAVAILRSELLLSQGKAAEAREAAMAARADDPGAAAALVARAVMAGAALPEVPEGADAKSDPVLALARFVTAQDARRAAGDGEIARKVTGWRAGLLRAEALAEWGELAEALKELEAVVRSGEVDAVIQGNLARALVASRAAGAKGAPPVGLLDGGRWAAEAARRAAAQGDAQALSKALELALSGLLRGGRADEAAGLVAELRETLDKLGVEGAAAESLAAQHATVALAAGRPLAARAALDAAGEPSEDLRWTALWVAWTLRDPAALATHADKLSGPRGQVAKAMVAALDGRIDDAAGLLPSTGLKPRDALYTAQLAASLAGDRAPDRLADAVKHADTVGDLGLRIATRLELEDAVRHTGPALATAQRAAVSRLAPAGPAGQALRVELAVREVLATGKARLPEGELPALAKAWRSAVEGQSAMVTGSGVAPIVAFSEGRVKRASGDAGAAAAYRRALESLPLHRRGRLASGTALDGSQGLPIFDDLVELAKGKPSENALAAGVVLHELGHRERTIREGLADGRDRFVGLAADKREALLDAAAGARAGVTRWLAGTAPFPSALLEALEAAETAAAEDARFGALVLQAATPDLAAITKEHNRLAMLSYVERRGRVLGLAISPDGGLLRDHGPAAAVRRASDQHMGALLASAQRDGRASHAAGNELRRVLVDPYAGVLTGHGWYLVVGPGHLQRYSFSTFPEQANGLRWLADIRTIGNLPRLGLVPVAEEEFDPDGYDPDYLMLGEPQDGEEPEPEPETPKAKAKAKAKSKSKSKAEAEAEDAAGLLEDGQIVMRCRSEVEGPQEFAAGRRHFEPAFLEQCTGVYANSKRLLGLAPKARYLHIGGVPAAGSGGFKLADRELGLEEIRRLEMVAELVVITASATPEVQRRRAQAFLDAGAKAVMVSSWDVEKDALERMMDGFWAALNRDRPVARAVADARDSLMRDSLLGEDLDDPALWGSLVLYTTP